MKLKFLFDISKLSQQAQGLAIALASRLAKRLERRTEIHKLPGGERIMFKADKSGSVLMLLLSRMWRVAHTMIFSSAAVDSYKNTKNTVAAIVRLADRSVNLAIAVRHSNGKWGSVAVDEAGTPTSSATMIALTTNDTSAIVDAAPAVTDDETVVTMPVIPRGGMYEAEWSIATVTINKSAGAYSITSSGVPGIYYSTWTNATLVVGITDDSYGIAILSVVGGRWSASTFNIAPHTLFFYAPAIHGKTVAVLGAHPTEAVYAVVYIYSNADTDGTAPVRQVASVTLQGVRSMPNDYVTLAVSHDGKTVAIDALDQVSGATYEACWSCATGSWVEVYRRAVSAELSTKYRNDFFVEHYEDPEAPGSTAVGSKTTWALSEAGANISLYTCADTGSWRTVATIPILFGGDRAYQVISKDESTISVLKRDYDGAYFDLLVVYSKSRTGTYELVVNRRVELPVISSFSMPSSYDGRTIACNCLAGTSGNDVSVYSCVSGTWSLLQHNVWTGNGASWHRIMDVSDRGSAYADWNDNIANNITIHRYFANHGWLHATVPGRNAQFVKNEAVEDGSIVRVISTDPASTDSVITEYSVSADSNGQLALGVISTAKHKAAYVASRYIGMRGDDTEKYNTSMYIKSEAEGMAVENTARLTFPYPIIRYGEYANDTTGVDIFVANGGLGKLYIYER